MKVYWSDANFLMVHISYILYKIQYLLSKSLVYYVSFFRYYMSQTTAKVFRL